MPETTQFGDSAENSGLEGTLKPNTILVARFKILGVLGGGGQGAVYQARDLNFPEAKRLVAVKEMNVTNPDPAIRLQTMKTFQREANILATLSHSAIPTIYDFFDQNDRAYLVMEYINGSDLEALLVKTKKLPMEKILEWAIDLCDVLHYLHSHTPEQIIFRDMKPANIMVDALGKVRLIDFGIAKVFVSGEKQTMIGTEGYSAPEQYKGNANPLSDVYSLGATLHHVITRKDPRLEPPFSFSERPIMQLNPETPQAFAEIIEKALAFEPENRWQSLAEMKATLESLRFRGMGAAASPIAARPSNPMSGSAASGNQATGFFDDISDVGGIQPRWVFKTEDEIRSSPVAFQGMAFVGSYDTNMWAIKLEDGSFVWKRATEGGIASSPVIDSDNKRVLFGSDDASYVALDYRNGSMGWTHRASDKIRSGGALAHGHIFFGSDDGNLYAVFLSNGRMMWAKDTGSAIRTRPFVTADRIIVGNEGGELMAMELNGQSKLWSFRIKKAISSSPVVDLEGICYVGAFDGNLYAIDGSVGYSHWRYRTNGPIISSPCVDGTYVYVASTDGRLYCINSQTGKERWIYEAEKPIVSSPIVYEGLVYIASSGGTFHAIETKTGKETWHFTTGGPITGTPFLASQERLILVPSLDGKLYALPLINK